MKPSLGLRASQHLALTPQLQQSIRLLQMSTAELEDEVDRLVAQNPLLETSDDPVNTATQSDAPADVSENTDLNAEPLAGSMESWSANGASRVHDDNDWPSSRAQPVSLRDHLHEQAHGLALSDRDMAWLDTLIESLDDDGYLREDLHELEQSIAAMFHDAFGERLDADEMQLGLKLLQSMDPPGIGARDLQECLRLQLDRMAAVTASPGFGTPCIQTAQRIVGDAALLQMLGARNYAALCKTLACDRHALKDAIALIQKLSPKPGNAFEQDAAQTVIPDVIAYRAASPHGAVWQVRLNESAVPRLSINPAYADLIRQDRASTMASQLAEARWVIKNIRQRFDTILRVAQAIAMEQQAFFEHGELAMKPLVLREIAARCELHESTVSRVTANKYMLTPRGTFELKYFFTSHVATQDGGAASSASIRAKLRQWIGEENPTKPLSDQHIADRFAAEGIQVARRTIAKYREALKIEPAGQRKKL